MWEKRSGKETEGTKIEKYEEEGNRKKETRSNYGRRIDGTILYNCTSCLGNA